jgi:hypothetical protein
MFPIASVTVGSGGASTLQFSSIPQNFTHLQVRLFGRSSTAAGSNVGIQFNNDTGGNYRVHYLGGDGSSNFSGDFGASQIAGNVGWTAGSSNTANAFGVSVVDILDYTNTNKYKTLKSLNGIDGNGTGLTGLWSSVWFNTAAITQINIGAAFVQYTRADLYGIQTSNATGA